MHPKQKCVIEVIKMGNVSPEKGWCENTAAYAQIKNAKRRNNILHILLLVLSST